MYPSLRFVASRRSIAIAAMLGGALFSASSDARAVDLPKVGGAPVKLDITETSVLAQRFAARQGEVEEDQGYFSWLNRLNLVLGWKKFTLGARIDSSVYALRPEDRFASTDPNYTTVVKDGSTRYRDAIYPAKLWLTYRSDGVEVTAGDSYVQFGRGLVLSMRKVDELGVDTTLFGGKVTIQKDPFGVTLVAGLANPARVDEPTGRAHFPSNKIPAGGGLAAEPSHPLFGSDRIIGAQLQAGRGLPVIASTHAVHLTKCAPYRYDANGEIIQNPLNAPIGTCEEPSRSTWLGELPSAIGPTLARRETLNAGQSVEVPSLWGHGNLYVEGAVQKRSADLPNEANTTGNALYASLVTTGGPVSNTLEVKSYRNFYPLAGSANLSRAAAFANIAYSMPPTAEPIISDTMFGFFNACVTGARDRLDYRFSPTMLGYATFGYFVSRSESPGGACDRFGRSTADERAATTNHITDGSLGVEWRFDDDKSILFANVNARNDVTETNLPFYRELAAQYSLTKYISGPYAIELAGRHRYRIQHGENIRGSDFDGEPWWQGEHQNALKIAPKWVLSQGFEYTTFVGQPTYYVNGGILYKFTSDSNIRIYAGQNRGGLRCVSGICRMFPTFSGARIELTLRF